MKCFHCIPEFVWERTFEELKDDSAALVNCSRASSSWNKMLTSKKTDFLISLVLPLLAKELSFADLKLCRIISRNWKNAVDGLNERAPELLPYFKTCPRRGESTDLYEWKVMPLPFDGRTEFRGRLVMNKISQMTNNVKIPTLNIFPTRIVGLDIFVSTVRFDTDLSYIGYERGLPPSPKRVTEEGFFDILELFGSHIWHLVIRIDLHICDMNNYVRNVIKMLELTPNLISLTLHILNGEPEVTNWVHAGPLPPGRSITTLSMPTLGTSSVSGFLTTTYGHQLESLECYLINFSPFKQEKVFEFSKLKTLKLWFPGGYLRNLSSKMTAPFLERLILELDGMFCGQNANLFWDLINAIGCFSSSLTELRTYGSFNDTITFLRRYAHPQKLCADLETKNAEVCQFPRMKTFRIHISFWSFPDLNWVLSKFNGLEELILERSIPGENLLGSEEDLKYYSEDDVVSAKALADLWLLLPNLQKIDIAESNECQRLIKRPC